MDAARKALWYIESHYTEDLDLADIARVVGLSPFHLSRLFQASTGSSVVRYLRGRRLTQAAHQLAAGASDILSVALEAGYASHGAFTRAFGEQFGCTPELVRERGVDGLPLVNAIKLMDASGTCRTPPRLVEQASLLVAGIGARHRGMSVGSIPSQWQRLLLESSRYESVAYGVCCNSDEEGHYDFLAACTKAGHARLGPLCDSQVAPQQTHAAAIGQASEFFRQSLH